MMGSRTSQGTRSPHRGLVLQGWQFITYLTPWLYERSLLHSGAVCDILMYLLLHLNLAVHRVVKEV